MAVNVIMPKQGLQMTEGTILTWKVREGQDVQKDQPIAEIETDKAVVDVFAPASGTLLRILHAEGETVGVAETIAIIGEAGESVETAGPPATARLPVESSPAAPAVYEREDISPSPSPAASSRIFASPRARMRAEEKGLPLERISGSGPDGLIIERDVLRIDTGRDQRRAGTEAVPPRGAILSETLMNGQPGRLVPLTAMRTAIARHLRESLSTAAQANHRMDADFSEPVRLRKQFEAGGLRISYTDIVVKAAAQALRATPLINSALTEWGLFFYQEINVGIAVALDEGLVVPVVKGADALSLGAIHARFAELADRARAGRMEPSDAAGGTFTVTNLGMYDVDSFTAIINQPQSGILAVGRIVDKPVVAHGEIVIRPMATLSLTYDHRVIDGAPAAQFLRLIKDIVENPLLLL